MKNIKYLGWTVILAGPALAAAGESVVLTLEKTLDMAERRNRQAHILRGQVEDAREAARQARARLLPNIGLSSSQSRIQTAGGAMSGAGGETAALRPAPFDAWEGKVTASMPVIAPKTFADWRVSKQTHEAARLDYETQLQEILAAAARLFFTHLRNGDKLAVIDANIERDRVLLDLARNQVRAGVATPIDETRAEVRLAADEKFRLQQETMLLQSALDLKRILDMDLDSDLRLVKIADEDENWINRDPLPLETLLNQRPDYLKAKKELARNRMARRAADWERLPVISFFGEWGYESESAFDGDEEEAWMAGVSLSVPIFEGFRIHASRRRAGLLIRIQEHALESLELEASADYRLARHDVASRFKQIQISRKKVTLSEKELDLARTRFQEGVADNSDVVMAQASLAEAHDDLVESIYQYHLSRLNHAKARGDARLLLREE